MTNLPSNSNPFGGVVVYDATAAQKIKIGKMARLLGIKEQIEDRPMTKGEAGRLLRELYTQLNYKNRTKQNRIPRRNR